MNERKPKLINRNSTIDSNQCAYDDLFSFVFRFYFCFLFLFSFTEKRKILSRVIRCQKNQYALRTFAGCLEDSGVCITFIWDVIDKHSFGFRHWADILASVYSLTYSKFRRTFVRPMKIHDLSKNSLANCELIQSQSFQRLDFCMV